MNGRTPLALILLYALGGCTSLREPPAAPPSPLPYGVDMSFLHPVQKPESQLIQTCAEIPTTVREHVHVYFINGLDPLYVGNFKGLCRYVKSLGFPHSTCTEMGNVHHLRLTIGQIRRVDRAARFVLVGYSAGANYARDLAHELHEDGITVDLLVYVGGDTIRNEPASRPANVARVLNITGHGLLFLGGDLFFNGAEITGASNHRLDARHMLLPSHPETAELLGRELLDLYQEANR